MDDEVLLTIPVRRGRAILLSVLLLAAGGIQLAAGVSVWKDEGVGWVGVLSLSILLGGTFFLSAALALYHLRLWARPRQGLVVTRDTVWVGVAYPRPVTVQWSEIHAVEEYDWNLFQINLKLRRPESSIQATKGYFTRAFLRLQHSIYGTPVAFTTWLLAAEHSQLFKQLRQFHKATGHEKARLG